MKNRTMLVPATQPRNPYVQLCKFRRAGAHQKTNKAQRRADKVKLHGELA